MTDFPITPPQIVLVVGLLIFLSVLVNRVSDRLGVPTLLMFLAVGMLAGSDGIGGIYFDNAGIANLIGVFALAFILFSGGLDTDWRTVRPVLWRAMILSTAGVIVTAALVGVFAWKVLGFQLKEGLLFGALVSSTDAAAVFGIMRSRRVGLKGQLKPLLELESGSNDPMATFLTVSIMALVLNQSSRWAGLIPSLAVNLSLGAAAGAAVGLITAFVFNRLRLEYEGLYSVLSISVVLLTYGLSETIHGNGFLAVYTCGIVLGNTDFLRKQYLLRFHDAIGWLMQVVLFLVLGLLVFPSRLPEVAVPALLASAFLMCVARPAAVYLGLWRSRFTVRERTLAAWTGLRGAVPIVLATFPFMAGYEHSDKMFDMVFFVVLSSVLLQGTTLMTLARWLKVDTPADRRPQSPIQFEKRAGIHSEMHEIEISAEAVAAGRHVSELGLPPGVLILLVRRGSEFIVPTGHTKVEAFDTLIVLADHSAAGEARRILLARG